MLSQSDISMSDAEEQRLVQESQNGDGESFNQIVLLYQRRIYNICFRMLGDTDAASDATQDAFISAFRKIETFRGGSFRSWLTRIAVNTCYDILRARKRRPTVSLDANLSSDDETEYTFDPPDAGETPEQFLQRRELSDALQKAIFMLPEDQRIIVILSDVQGMSYQEIVEATGSTLGTVKSRLSRGRTKLRDILKKWELLPSGYRHDT